ncbi:MAG: FHA domain-containing protein, partial [Pseudomonadota bacterium]
HKGDVITIGKHTIVFELADGEAGQSAQQGLVEQTMVLDTNEYRAMVGKSSPTLTTQAEKKEKEAVAVLSYLKGGNGEVELTKKLIKIGKDPSSDIVISGFMMGKTAATISKRPTGYFINFVEGMTKPKINGKTIKETAQLKEFDKIELGSATMEFIIKE